MVNPIVEILAFLNSQTSLTTLTTQFHGGLTYPPKEYIPGDRAIVFNTRGGNLSYDSTLLIESFGFKCYGANEVQAYELGQTLIVALHDKHWGKISSAQVQATGVPTQEPEVSWWYSTVYFLLQFKSGLGA